MLPHAYHALLLYSICIPTTTFTQSMLLHDSNTATAYFYLPRLFCSRHTGAGTLQRSPRRRAMSQTCAYKHTNTHSHALYVYNCCLLHTCTTTSVYLDDCRALVPLGITNILPTTAERMAPHPPATTPLKPRSTPTLGPQLKHKSFFSTPDTMPLYLRRAAMRCLILPPTRCTRFFSASFNARPAKYFRRLPLPTRATTPALPR